MVFFVFACIVSLRSTDDTGSERRAELIEKTLEKPEE